MDYKEVLEKQIGELEKLQSENINNHSSIPSKIDAAVIVSEQIRKLIQAARNMV